jgi:type VI secretion system protein ImpF
MARNLGDVTITLSVLDRLIDLEPSNQFEAQLSRSQTVRQLKNSVRRDLEALLNTRRIAELPDESLREVNRSGYVFGLPDFSTYAASVSADRTKLLRHILAAINLFEPRLANVRVMLVDAQEVTRKDIRVRIEAMLRMDPVPEPISFDTVIEIKSGNCRLMGADSAR